MEVGVVTRALRQQTFLPDPNDPQFARVYDFLAAHEQAGRDMPQTSCYLSGPTPSDRVELPAELYLVLRQVVEALRSGLGVTIRPEDTTLTTQQAADLLGISRPTLVRLLDQDVIPYERANSHRKILLRDLLVYRDRRREQQYAALEAMAAEDDDEDLDAMLTRAREVRKAVGRRRATDR
jgi:excisionase family DNA binding protein